MALTSRCALSIEVSFLFLLAAGTSSLAPALILKGVVVVDVVGGRSGALRSGTFSGSGVDLLPQSPLDTTVSMDTASAPEDSLVVDTAVSGLERSLISNRPTCRIHRLVLLYHPMNGLEPLPVVPHLQFFIQINSTPPSLLRSLSIISLYFFFSNSNLLWHCFIVQ